MERVEADFAPVEVEPREEFARDRDFIRLFIHHRAAQVVLAGHAHRAQHMVAAGMSRRLAIDHDEFFGRRRAAHLGLEGEDRLLDFPRIDPREEPVKSGLAGRRIAARLRIPADAQSRALRLAQPSGEGGEILLPARRVGQMGAGDDGQQ